MRNPLPRQFRAIPEPTQEISRKNAPLRKNKTKILDQKHNRVANGADMLIAGGNCENAPRRKSQFQAATGIAREKFHAVALVRALALLAAIRDSRMVAPSFPSGDGWERRHVSMSAGRNSPLHAAMFSSIGRKQRRTMPFSYTITFVE
jgi:hypothetical protein